MKHYCIRRWIFFISALLPVALCQGQNTDCTAETPFEENFDNYGYGETVFPTCWTLVKNIDGTPPANVSHTLYSTSPASLRMSCTNTANGEYLGYYAIAIMPELTDIAANQFMMRMKLRAPSSGIKLEVGVCSGTQQFNHNFTAVDTLTITTPNQWTEYLVDFSSYSGSGTHPALRMQGNLQPSANMEVYIDEILVEGCGVWHQTLLKRNAHNLWVQWDEYGDPQVDVEYGPTGFVDGSGITLTNVTSPLQVSGLDPSTTYDLRFHTGCSNGPISTSYRSLTQTTLEGPRNDLNLCEGFEDGGTVPTGWRRNAIYDGTPIISTNYSHSGSRSLSVRPYYYSNIRPIVVLPMVDTVDIRSLSISFWAYSNYSTSGTIDVGVMEYPEEESNFTPVATVNVDASGTWQRKQLSLASYDGEGQYLALRFFDTYSYNTLYIDDVQVGTCILNGVYATNIGSHTVELRWDTVDDSYHGDSVVVQYKKAGSGQWTVVHIPVRGDEVQTLGDKQTVTISDLEANKNYEFRIHGQCDTMVQACAVTTLTEHTLAQDLSLPYCVNFTGVGSGNVPAGWTRTTTYDNKPCVVNSHQGHSGITTLAFYASGDLSNNHSTIALPMLETESVQGLTVSFYAFSDYNGGRFLEIGVMDDPNDESTFTTVATVTPTYDAWGAHVCDLTSYTGTGRYIALRWYIDYYWYYQMCYVDDLIVSAAATANCTVGSVTSHGATISWQGAGRSYNGAYVEWGPAGFVRGMGTKDTVSANTFSLTIDTLQPGTNYDCFITALSSEGNSLCDYTRLSFATFAQPTAAPYCYGFEDVSDGGFPLGWTRPVTYESRPYVTSVYSHSGSRSLNFYTYRYGNTFYDNMTVMPYLEEEDLEGLTLSFYLLEGGYYCRLLVGMVDDPNATELLDTLATFTVDYQNSWTRQTVDLSQYTGTARHIAFLLTETSSYNSHNVYLDDIAVNRCSVSRVRAYSETTTTATLDWIPEGAMDSVVVQYWVAGSNQRSTVSTTDTVVILTGLTPGTNYECHILPYCVGSDHACSESVYMFSTLEERVGDGWCCDFESNTGTYGMPLGWSRPAMIGGWPYIYIHSDAQYYTSYNSAFEYRTSSSGCNIAVMPASEDSLGSLVISLMVRNTNTLHPDQVMLIVGAMPNPFDTAAFVPIDTIRPTYDYRRHDVSLASYSGDFRHIAFKYLDPANSNDITYTDDLVLSHCQPTHVNTLAVTDHSITLSWQRMGYSDNTVIKWRAGNGQWTTVTVADTAYTLTGLTANISHTILLYGSCADVTRECLAVKLNVRTLAEPMAPPYCENFENNTLVDGLPNGWSRPYGDPNESKVTYDNNHNPGNYSLCLYSYNCNNTSSDRTTMAVMPWLEADSLNGLWLELYTWHTYTGLRLEVGLMTNPLDTATFTPIETLSGTSGWQRQLVDLSAYTGDGRYIAFRAFSTYCYSGYIYLDDISVRSCALLTARAATPTRTSLTLYYTGTTGTQGAIVEYKEVSGPDDYFTPGDGDTMQITGTYTLSNLNEASWYAFHFYPDCGEGSDGCNYLTSVAQTLHPSVQVPYCENFDLYASGNYPNNWRRLSTYGTDYPRTEDYNGRSTPNALCFTAQDTLLSLAVMPGLYVGTVCPDQIDSLFANFWTRFTNNWGHAALVVGVVTDANDASAFIASDTIRATAYNTWEHHTVTLRNFSSANSYVAYKFISTNGSYAQVYLDDLCMEKCVASNVTVSDITQNSITVTWTSHGVDSLLCEYGPQGFAPGSGTSVVLHSSPAVINGLLDGTDYNFSFASACGCESNGDVYLPGGGSPGYAGGEGGPVIHPPVQVDSIRTQAGFLQVPYCETFEEYDSINWPHSWRRIGGLTPGYPTVTHHNRHSGSHSLDFYAPVGSSNLAALAPLESGRVNEMVLSFQAYASNENAMGANARFEVGIMTDPDNAATFIPLDTVRLTATNQWQQHITDLAPYAGSGQYVAFRFAPYNAQYHFFVDDIYLGTCAISDITLSSTSTDVSLSWQNWHTPSQVLIEYGPQGYIPGTETPTGSLYLLSSPATLTGIDPDSNYDFYVTAICGENASAGCHTLPLTLNPKLRIPYCEDFENLPGGTLPELWKLALGRDSYPLTETQYGQQVMAFYPCYGTDNTVLLPPLSEGDSLESKWVYAQFAASSSSSIHLDYGFLTDTANASTFVQMGSMENGAYEQLREFNQQLHYEGPATIGNRLALRARSLSGCRWIRLAQLIVSNHPYPTGITSTPLGISQRRLQWNNEYNNPCYGIEYGYGNHWQTIPLSDSCTALLTGLQPATRYEVYFISPQGERFCLPYTFTTDQYTTLPYCEDFESHGSGQGSAPDGWTCYYSHNGNNSRPYINNDPYYAYNSEHSFYFYSHPNYLQYAALPDIGIDSLRHLSIRLQMRTSNHTTTMLEVGIMDTPDDITTFQTVDTLRCSASNTCETKYLSLSGYTDTSRYLAFRILITSYSWENLSIDDLHLSSCPLPVFTVAGAHQVKASLPLGAPAPNYYIEYDTAGFERGTGTVVQVNENPYYITHLDPDKQYTFYAGCDPAASTCTPPTTLTTAQEQPLPYCDNFDSYTSGEYSTPTGWYNHNGGENNNRLPYVRDAYYNSCCNSYYFYTYQDYLEYAALPDLTIDSIKHMELSFNMRSWNNNWQYSYMIVGVMDDRSDYSTFTPVDTLYCTNGNSYQPQQVTFSSYTGDGRFIAFQIVSTNGWRELLIDDLRISPYPAPQITLLDATTIHIVRNSNQEPWIEMAPKDTAQGADTNRWFHLTSDTLLITGLDHLTTYDFYHHLDSGTVTCFPPLSITTSTILPMPHCDNFSSYTTGHLPTGWTKSNPYNIDYPRKISNGSIQFYNGCYSDSRSYAILPILDIDSLQHAELYLNVKSDNNNLYLIVGVMTDGSNTNTFTAVDTLTPTTTGSWQTLHTSLQKYHGEGRFIAFCLVNPNGNCSSMYIDDLYIQACPRPSLQLVNANSIQAIQRGNTDYWLEYFRHDGTGDTTLLHVTFDTLVIDNLDYNTTYDFYARCDSASTSSCYTLTASITTSYSQNIPYCEEFADCGTGTAAFPSGWQRLTDNNTHLNIFNHNSAPDHRTLRFYTGNNAYAYAVLPELEVNSIGNLTLRTTMLSQQGYSPDTYFLEVGVMTSADDTTTFQIVDTLRNTTDGIWETLSLSLTSYNGQGHFLALRMHNTGSNWRTIYLDRLELLTCDIPPKTTFILHSYNQVRVEATEGEQSRTGFWVEYDTAGFEQGSGQFYFINHIPSVITLDTLTTYDFYLRCDTVTATCLDPHTVTTLAPPVEVPYCSAFENCAIGELPEQWTTLNVSGNAVLSVQEDEHHSGTQSLKMTSYRQRPIYAVLPYMVTDSVRGLSASFWLKGNSNATITVGVMSDPNDYTSFMPIQQITCPTEWTRELVSFASAAPDGRFLALRYTTNSYNYPAAYIDDLHVAPCGASRMRITEVEANHVTFDWEQTGTPQIIIEYGLTGFIRGTGQIVTVVTPPPFTLTGLNNLTNYQFYFDALCDEGDNDWCTTNYSDSATLFTPTGGTGCIDPTNLTAEYTTCFIGNYGNPYAEVALVDHGAASIESRHTIHYDTTERDARTGGQLRTVPTGAEASVRLGNWGTESQAEAVAYNLAIDTTLFDLLILKYAAVLQDNDHPHTAQPRFKLELLDTNGVLLDTCSAADFIANQALGWNLVPETYVLWKDWTTVGVDVSAFHGMTVTVRLTVYDCSNGDHFGYAYFTLSCMNKRLVTSLCGDVLENSFTAPSGFAYSWYSSADPNIFSTDQTIVVPTNNTMTYYCNLAFVDKPACNFTMSAFAGTRYPLSLFDSAVVIRDCHFEVSFNNRSTISMDHINPIGTGESVETATWNFGNGNAPSTQYHPTVIYEEPGTYTVQLVSTIAGGACTDTLEKEITLAFPDANPHIVGPNDRCAEAVADTLLLLEAASWNPWNNDTIIVSPLSDTTYTLVATDSNGCQHTMSHTLNVHPVYHDTIRHTLCNGATYTFVDTTLATAGTFSRMFTTDTWLCDSSVTVVLTVNNHSNSVLTETIVENQLPWTYHDSLFTDSVSNILVVFPNAAGCDSLVTYSLHVHWNVDTTLFDTVCESEFPVTWNSISFENPGTLTDTLTNRYGADSLVVMNLAANPTTYSTVHETVIENDLPHTYYGLTLTTDTLDALITTTNATGCDSVITYSLTVYWNGSTIVDSSICQDQLPLTWNNVTFTEAGTQADTLITSQGADSVVYMTLYVSPVYNDTIPQRLCDNKTLTFEDSLYTGADAGFHSHLLQTSAGCDSLRVLNLTVNATTTGDTIANECDSFTWYDSTYILSTDTATHLTVNAEECDSTVTMHLTVRQSTTSTVLDTVVENQLPWSYHNSLFADSVSHSTIVFQNTAGCDSVVDYSLHVYWNVDTTLYDTLCNSALPIVWNGLTIDTTLFGVSAVIRREVTYQNRFGADSTVILLLSLHPLFDHHSYDTICDNQSFSFGDSTFLGANGSTTHLDSLLSVHGCDSLSTLHLTVRPTYDLHFHDTICSNQNISFEGSTLATTGTFPFTLLTSQFPCDSLRTLHLQVWPAYDNHTYDTICDDSARFFIDSLYRQTGDYTYPFLSIHACDSLEALHLKVYPTYDLHFYDTVYDGDHFTFEQSVYSSAGIYPHLLQGTFGCDSLRTLHLTVNPRTYLDSTLCQNALPITWNGVTFADGVGSRQGSIQTLADSVHLVSSSGADSLVVMTLTVNDTASTILTLHACDSLRWQDGIVYTASTSSPTFTLSGNAGCDSVLHLDLTVNYTHFAIDSQAVCDSILWIDGHWYSDDTTGIIDTIRTVAGCDSIVTLELSTGITLHTYLTDTMCHNDTYSWHGLSAHSDNHLLTEFFTLVDTLRASDGCDSVVTLSLTKLALPTFVLDTTPLCHLRQYRIDATVTAPLEPGGAPQPLPYLLWSSDPADTLLDGHETDNPVYVKPMDATQYLLFADYREPPLCPATISITLHPIVIPEAVLQVTPQALDYPNLNFAAHDISHLNGVSRTWFIDWNPSLVDGPSLSASARDDADSVLIALELFNGQCRDTALALIPIHRINLFAPNIFTPLTNDGNNRFFIATSGVISGELFIYNREGLLVHHSADYTLGWDGRNSSGTICPQGNYVWKLVYRAENLPLRERVEVGSVLLIK
ncbi:MAG: choice-of-anchor J domain-containing protein [bacterium]